jgi:hypothetical protein
MNLLPEAGSKSEKAAQLSVLAILWCVLLLMHQQLFSYADDDSYIHLRIVKNLLQHGVPYFNVDERVMSSSSSGWTIVLYLVFRLFGYSEQFLPLLHATVLTAAVWVYARLFAQLTHISSLLSLLFSAIMVTACCHFASLGCMETTFALTLLGAGAWLYYRSNAAAFLLLTAAPFFRMELWAAWLLFTMAALLFKRLPVWKMALFALAGATPFVFYNIHFFGTNVPNTVGAKSIIYQLTYTDTLHAEWLSFIQGNIAGKYVSLGLVILFLVLMLRKVVQQFQEAENYILTAFGAGIALAYVLKKILIFPWYVPIYTLPLVFGFAVWIVREKQWRLFSLWALFLAPYLFLFIQAAYAALFEQQQVYKNFKPGARVRQYLAVGAQLKHKFPNARLLTSEIGGLGYAFEGKVLDGCGLISPEALKYHPMQVPQQRSSAKAGAIPLAYVIVKNPELVVSLEAFCEEFARSAFAREHYYRVQLPVFTAHDMHLINDPTLWGSQYLLVYVRKDVKSSFH